MAIEEKEGIDSKDTVSGLKAGLMGPFAAIGDVTLNMQNNLDMILPRLLPAGIVAAIYWMLGKKNMTSTKAIFIVLVVCVALSALGVISK